ncbi:MAG: hypothetical protein V4635_00085 [Bacteroidota bacterium]
MKKYRPVGFTTLSNKSIASWFYFAGTVFTPQFFKHSYELLLCRARGRPIQTKRVLVNIAGT